MTQQSKYDQIKDQAKDKDNDKQTAKTAREIALEIGETRTAITSDILELNDKFSSANVKESAKEVIGGVKEAALEQAAEIKDAVVEKAIEVKAAVVDKAVEMKDAAAEKVVEAKDAMVETMEEVGEQAIRAGSVTWRFTKANAVPLALFGAGAAWLVANNRRARDQRWRSEGLYRPAYEGEARSDEDDELYARPTGTPSARSTASERGQRRTQLHDRPIQRGGTSKSVSARVESRAHGLMDQASGGIGRAEHAIADGASRGAEYMQDRFQRAGTASRDFAEANPLLVAMAALATGIGVGMLLPNTDRENQLLAPSRAKFQRLIGDVKDAAIDVAQVAKDTANESVNALA